jgi:hypothetical protein
MDYLVICLVGFIGGGFAAYIALDAKRKLLQRNKEEVDAKAQHLRDESESLKQENNVFTLRLHTKSLYKMPEKRVFIQQRKL